MDRKTQANIQEKIYKCTPFKYSPMSNSLPAMLGPQDITLETLRKTERLQKLLL